MADGVPGPGPEGQAVPSNSSNPIDTGSPNQEQQNLARVNEVLSRPGIKKVLQKFSDQFDKQRGKEAFYGIRPDGLVVGTRQVGVPGIASYDVWAVDASLPSDQIEAGVIQTTIKPNFIDRFRNGVTIFPSHSTKSTFDKLALIPEEEIRARYPNDPDGMAGNVNFYRKTGGFNKGSAIESPDGVAKVGAGGQRLYPLNLGK